MDVELICVGTELLLGEIVNTNAAYIAKRLAEEGMNLYHACVVGDNPKRLKAALELAFSRSDLIITTGGLGPTADDVTKEVIADLLGQRLVFDAAAYENLIKRLKANVKDAKISENNRKQALVPEGCDVYENEYGTAPGFHCTVQNKHIIVLPGPPKEMRAMFEAEVTPFLRTQSHLFYARRMVKTHGLKESTISEYLQSRMEQKNPTVATYAKPYGTDVRVMASASSLHQAEQMCESCAAEVCAILKDAVYSIDGMSLEETAIAHLQECGLKLMIVDGGSRGVLLSLLGKGAMEEVLLDYRLMHTTVSSPLLAAEDKSKEILTVSIASPKMDADGKMNVTITYQGAIDEQEIISSYQDGEGFYNRISYAVLDRIRRI